MYYQRLKGKNLYLSPADLNNEVSYMVRWLNEDNELIYQNGFYKQLFNEDKVKDLLNKWNEGPYMFSIINNEDEFMGHISLFNISEYSLTLGIYIGKEYRNLGYGSEAMELIIDYIFNELNMNNIHLEVFSYNSKAIEFYKKLGFKVCGIWHKEKYAHGKYHNVIMMEYLKDDYGGKYEKDYNFITRR